jgi:hypothetical protein
MAAVQNLQAAVIAVHLQVEEVVQKTIPVAGDDLKINCKSALLAAGGFFFFLKMR